MTNSSLADPCATALTTKVHAVFRHLPKALAGEEDAVHEMRVAGRRLRVALPQLAKKPDGRRARRALLGVKALTRAAGASRDLDVMSAGLEEALSSERSRRQAQLVSRLRAARRRARKHMAEVLLDLDIARLRRDLRVLIARGCEPVPLVLLRVRNAQLSEAQELRTALDALGADYAADPLHQLRIRARRLRYAAELEAELTGRPSTAVEILKGLQDELGLVRDRYLVAQWLQNQAQRAQGRGAAEESAEAQRQDARFRSLSREGHRQWLADDPRARLDEAMRRLGHRSSVA
jgi:CHAD domain-containing protein